MLAERNAPFFTLPLAGRVGARLRAGVGVIALIRYTNPHPQPLPAVRAFTPVFDGLWGRGAGPALGMR
jgi:hypothetical protein